ncbi:MAG: glycoside hydrolase family 99-like domain-containing protein [Janthinobacterium lividum]
MSLMSEHRRNTEPGPDFQPEGEGYAGGAPKVRLIAYYLPQFHPIPENDRAWGKGFTEWTNVTKATPTFSGHYQPHLPAELGFYDLRSPEVLRRQSEMAKKYGIYGFCFHHYWFNGKPLLDAPINALLADPTIDLPFCINWANENWTKRWDGKDKEIIVAQNHSPDDDLALAKSLEPLLRDPRYIRIDGRPLIMIYRPAALPDAKATLARWRAHFLRVGLGDPYLVMSQEHATVNPREYSFDGAAALPPRGSGTSTPLRRGLRKLSKFHFKRGGILCSYDEMVKYSISYRPEDFPFLPGVCPSWDNTARKGSKGQVFLGATPKKYAAWLKDTCEYVLRSKRAEERIVFVNAWNEWAEGAHLEPDRHFGYAHLEETAKVLKSL